MTTELFGHSVSTHFVVITCVIFGMSVCVGAILCGRWRDQQWRSAARRHRAVRVERGRVR